MCPASSEDKHTAKHWMVHCKALDGVGQRMFGHPRRELVWLATLPGLSVVFARKTLVDLGT